MRLETENLGFTYEGGVEALRGIDLVIKAGERAAIVGQNGAGKTTLVKHFNGLLRPTSGTVRVGDVLTSESPVSKLAARVGYVFQNPDEQLFCKTVEEEIIFGPKNLGFTPEKVEALVADALELSDLGTRKDENPYDLSPSWRKMVAMASIIAMDTPIIVLDEPTTGQDALNIARIANIVSTLHARGKTVITITHDIDFCVENFERLIAMAQGRIILDAPMAEGLAERDLLASTYVEQPQLTRLGARLGLARTVGKPDDFLAALQELRQ
ncbi:MAG: ABC transporter ATP-binding protein [Anaerolineae bacterium]|nr:ABC transporter ATP-binding protein [Anaerolineae bacterium]